MFVFVLRCNFCVGYCGDGVFIGAELIVFVSGFVLKAAEGIRGVLSVLFSKICFGSLCFDEPDLFFKFTA